MTDKLTAQIFDIKKFAVHDGDGIRTTVFFKGCPLRCVWCHNPEGLVKKTELAFFRHKCTDCGECARVCKSGAHAIENGEHKLIRENCTFCGECEKVCPNVALRLYGGEYDTDELLGILLEDRAFYEKSGGGITLSGGECLLYPGFCRELLEKCKQNGLDTAVDTSGYVPKEAISAVLPFTDTFLYDIKAYSPKIHEKYTGHENGLILENLHFLDASGAKVEVRIPYVPECNASEMEDIAKLLPKIGAVKKVRINPYHNFAGSKYGALGLESTMPKVALPTEAEIERVRKMFEEYGNCVCR